MSRLLDSPQFVIESTQLTPMADKKVAVVLGRFNPPTRGHYKVINSAIEFIRKNKNLNLEATPVVVVIGGSKSDSDKKKNPLSADERITFMLASGKADGCIFIIAPNAFDAFALIRQRGFEPIAIAAGSDRIHDYKRMLDKYFLTPSEEEIEHYVIHVERDESAIEKDEQAKIAAMNKTLADLSSSDVDDDEISGSLARRAVELGYRDEFAKIVGLESNPKLAATMFDKLKVHLK